MSFLANWRTTLAGVLAGGIGGSIAGYTNPDGSINWKALLIAVALAALGAMAKDHNVTGGTKAQS